MGQKCKDGLVIWEEVDMSILPQEYEKDELSVFIRMLISKVKEEHAKYQYNRDIKDYVKDIMLIMKVAENNGYQVKEYVHQESGFQNNLDQDTSGETGQPYNDGLDLDSIVDG